MKKLSPFIQTPIITIGQLVDDLRAKLAADGAVPEPGSPEDYAAAIDVDEKKWAPIVKSLNLKFE